MYNKSSRSKDKNKKSRFAKNVRNHQEGEDGEDFGDDCSYSLEYTRSDISKLKTKEHNLMSNMKCNLEEYSAKNKQGETLFGSNKKLDNNFKNFIINSPINNQNDFLPTSDRVKQRTNSPNLGIKPNKKTLSSYYTDPYNLGDLNNSKDYKERKEKIHPNTKGLVNSGNQKMKINLNDLKINIESSKKDKDFQHDVSFELFYIIFKGYFTQNSNFQLQE